MWAAWLTYFLRLGVMLQYYPVTQLDPAVDLWMYHFAKILFNFWQRGCPRCGSRLSLVLGVLWNLPLGPTVPDVDVVVWAVVVSAVIVLREPFSVKSLPPSLCVIVPAPIVLLPGPPVFCGAVERSWPGFWPGFFDLHGFQRLGYHPQRGSGPGSWCRWRLWWSWPWRWSGWWSGLRHCWNMEMELEIGMSWIVQLAGVAENAQFAMGCH